MSGSIGSLASLTAYFRLVTAIGFSIGPHLDQLLGTPPLVDLEPGYASQTERKGMPAS